MSYLVRKLYKRENIEKIGLADSVETMYADGAVGEFRTNSGTLSTWEIQSLEQIDDAGNIGNFKCYYENGLCDYQYKYSGYKWVAI